MAAGCINRDHFDCLGFDILCVGYLQGHILGVASKNLIGDFPFHTSSVIRLGVYSGSLIILTLSNQSIFSGRYHKADVDLDGVVDLKKLTRSRFTR